MPKEPDNTTVLYLRDTPRPLSRKLKAAAAIRGLSLNAYALQVLEEHVEGLEKRGLLPKPTRSVRKNPLS